MKNNIYFNSLFLNEATVSALAANMLTRKPPEVIALVSASGVGVTPARTTAWVLDLGRLRSELPHGSFPNWSTG